jgi:hypothetical protein
MYHKCTYVGLHVKCLIFVLDLNKNLISLEKFSKNIQMSNLMKIGILGAELFHADGRTDRQTDRYVRRSSSKFFERA